MAKKSLEKLVKSLALSLGIGVGALGLNSKANSQCNQPFQPDSSTIALWHLDENSGPETYDAINNSVGFICRKGCLERYLGGPASDLWANGIFGAAIRFELATDIRIPQPYPGNNDETFNVDNVTVEAYIKPETLTPPDTVNNFQAIARNQNVWIFGLDSSGKLNLKSYAGDIGIFTEVSGNLTVPLNRFTYVAFSYSKNQNRLRFYIDGNIDSELNLGWGTLGDGIKTIGVYIGAAYKNLVSNELLINPGQFLGTIDELRISNIERAIMPCNPTSTRKSSWGGIKATYR